MVSWFDAMLMFDAMPVEFLAGHVAVRRRQLALRFGSAMCNPLLCGTDLGFTAGSAFAGHPEVDDLSHA